VTIWSGLGVLTDYFDISQFFGFGESFINSKVLMGFMSGQLGTESFLQTTIMVMLVMTYVASAYVILCTIESGVSISRGFYHVYAGGSALGNLIYAIEVFLILGW